MFRKLLGSMIVMAVCIGFVTAEDFTATIKKVDGNKVTYSKFTFKDKKFEKSDDATLPAAANVKVTNGKFNKEDKKIEAGDSIEKGLKNEMFTKLSEKKEPEKDKATDKKKGFGFGGGLFAQITTSEDGKTITAITVMNFGGGKFGKDKKKTEDKKSDK